MDESDGPFHCTRMLDPWRRWTHEVLSEQHEDPFVALLEQRLSSGDQLVRVSIESPDFKMVPQYLVVLAQGSEVSSMSVRHSRAFTRWCFANSVRMETPAQEACRFDALLAERLEPLRARMGDSYTLSVIVEVLRRLGPPGTCAGIAGFRPSPAESGEARHDVESRLHKILETLARHLGDDLRYPEVDVAAILDAALERNLEKRFRAQGIPWRDGASPHPPEGVHHAATAFRKS